MLKESIKELDTAAIERKVKWRNVICGNDGAVIYGTNLWPTRDAANASFIRQLSKLREGAIHFEHPGNPPTIITKETYSWHMQLPITEEL